MSHAANEVRALVAGKPGGVNSFIGRWGKLVVDYATALLPDRGEPFAKMVEDILVDAVSQARVVLRAQTDEEVRAYVIECALRTTRARFREQLDGHATPEKATNSYTVEEIMARTSMTASDITAGISEGRLRAVRADNTMRIKGGDIPGLGDRTNVKAFHVSAAERELLCLHFRLNQTPEEIARYSGASGAHIESLIQLATMRIAEADARKRDVGADPKDTEMRRYLEGRLSDVETNRFEKSVVKDKVAQARLEELRSQRDEIRALFDSPAYDLSRISLAVRERNPHQPVAVPPAAALWVQVVGVAALLLLLHRVGAYLPPPDVRIEATEGAVSIDGGRPLATLNGGRLVVGQSVVTGSGGQAMLVLDASNRARLAGDSRVTLREPRPDTRQVLQLDAGELWARFISSGHAFAVVTSGEKPHEMHGDAAAEFDVALGAHAANAMPDNLYAEQASAFAAAFETGKDSLSCARAFSVLAGFRVGQPDQGIEAGDQLLELDRVPLDDLATLRRALIALPDTETASLQVLRGGNRLTLPLRRDNAAPVLLLRVFRGSVMLQAAGSQAEEVSRGQWALIRQGQPPLIGQRGQEDFHLLRMDAAERFKDRLHWLNTESFPLRSENSLIGLDRKLRELAGKLERLRESEIQRDGSAELMRFEEIMAGSIQSAQDRIARNQPLPRDTSPGSLSDEELVRAKDEVLGTIADWRRKATTGAWPTLGAAGKTLHSRIQREKDDMARLDAVLTQALLKKEEIAKVEESIRNQQAEIAKLEASALFDADGSLRKALDSQIADLAGAVKAGNEAKGRIELITLKLNELDQQLDDLRRKMPVARADVAAAELALKDIDNKLAAIIYTPGALQNAQTAAATASAALANAKADTAKKESDLADADSALAMSRTNLTKAEKDAEAPVQQRDRAQDILTDAVADRSAAQTTVADRKTELDAAQAELDALAAEDPLRAEAQKKLDGAKTAFSDAEASLAIAKKAAQDAKTAYDTADAKAVAAQKVVDSAKAAQTAAETKRTEAVKAKEDAVKLEAAATKADASAAANVVELKAAKVERESLDQQRLGALDTQAKANTAQTKLESEIAALDSDAQPRREKLAEERKLVAAADEAKATIEEVRRKRDQHQAISDEITLRGKDLAALTTRRDELAGSTLVTGYDAMLEEYRVHSARADALEFTRARALLEDQNFALAQKSAQDRYRETAQAVSAQAVAVLDSACLDYPGFALADNPQDAVVVRNKLLDALWKLYYDAGLDAVPDASAASCYYVAAQSGAGESAFKALDDRWKLALAQVFDKDRFERASRLKPADLAGKTDATGN